MFKFISFCLIILCISSCSQETLTTKLKFNESSLNCSNNNYSTKLLKFKSDTFGFSCSFPSNWDFQNITDTFSHGKSFSSHSITPEQWKIKSNDTIFLSKTAMATSWDSTDLSWAHCFQVTTWAQKESLEEIAVIEEEKIKNKYKAEILDKGDFKSNNINYKWFLFNRLDEVTGPNRCLAFYCKKENAKCYIITLNIIGLSNHQEFICKFKSLIETFSFN